MGKQDAEHYFSSQPATPAKRRTLSVKLAGKPCTLVTAGGIFSPDGVDKGTSILLAEAPQPSTSGNLLDIGCGWGPIALTLGLISPGATIYAVDVNERSLELTRENAATLKLSNVITAKPEDINPELRFDTIWSNPPIRVGKEELHNILLMWLPRLAVDGRAYLVVQKNLGADSLQRWLSEQLTAKFPSAGFDVVRDSTNKSFRVIRISRTAQ